MQRPFLAIALLVGVGAACFGGGWALHASQGAAPATVSPGGGLFIPNPEDSLFFIPMGGHGSSSSGIEAAREVSGYLETRDAGRCRAAIALYDAAIPLENFGGEYTSLRWLCEYSIADEAGRATMLENGDGRRLVDFYSPNDWKPLKDYLSIKYASGPGMEGESFRFMDELMRFNSPLRSEWEGTQDILRLLHLGPGDAVGDVGAGAGYFSYRFSDIVGPTGRVYAVELNPTHIRYISRIAKEEGRTNLEVITGPETGATGLAPGSVDVVFLCSTYQTIYTSMRDEERRVFLTSLKAALKPGGRVVISDNEPNVRNAVPYFGISVSRLLVAGQLEANGFRLVKEAQFIPQRYLLVLELAK